MSAIHKLSVDTAALFISRSTNSSPPQREKHTEVKRSRSHGSSPLPKRMQVQLTKSPVKENQSNDSGCQLSSQSPIFARSSNRKNMLQSGESNSSRIDGVETSGQVKEQKERKNSKYEKDSIADLEFKPRKKNSLVKNFLVNRLRSGSWHASSDSETSKGNTRLIRRVSADTFNGGDKEENCSKGPIFGNSYIELTGLIQHVLESHLRDEVYNSSNASEKCGLLSKVIEKAVKSRLNNNKKNFKICSAVYLGEIREDGIKMATQCAWEPNQDHFAMATYESDHLFVSAMVFAVEFDEGYDVTTN